MARVDNSSSSPLSEQPNGTGQPDGPDGSAEDRTPGKATQHDVTGVLGDFTTWIGACSNSGAYYVPNPTRFRVPEPLNNSPEPLENLRGRLGELAGEIEAIGYAPTDVNRRYYESRRYYDRDPLRSEGEGESVLGKSIGDQLRDALEKFNMPAVPQDENGRTSFRDLLRAAPEKIDPAAAPQGEDGLIKFDLSPFGIYAASGDARTPWQDVSPPPVEEPGTDS